MRTRAGGGARPGSARLCAVFAAAVLLAGGCEREHADVGDESRDDLSAQMRVCVSIPPQAFLLERIGGERVAIEVLVGPGQSPATYDPTPAQMVALERADLYFRIGVPFEDTLIGRIEQSMPALEIVDLREGIDLLPLEGHHHGPGEECVGDHGRPDPHTWLDPELMKVQARTVAEALARIDPDGEASYKSNLSALLDDLDRVHAEVTEILEPVRGEQMLVFHPAFGYFARAYGLEQVAIEVEGKEPGPRQLQRIVVQAREQRARAIFVQPEFAATTARAVAREIGAEVASLDPLARDYLENLREMARTVRAALGNGGNESDG